MILISVVLLESCSTTRSRKSPAASATIKEKEMVRPTRDNTFPRIIINTKNAVADSVVQFAETLLGVPYKYGSTVKEKGFDCSGFITYVFNHFNIEVPRVSKDFTYAGYAVPLDRSKPGDLILFTGTDTTGWVVGHMGMITENVAGNVKFIHSASGRSIGVIISSMSKYFTTRFVKVIRVFDE